MKKEAAWWEKLGKPQYGDEIVIRGNQDIMNFDPYFSEGSTSIYGGWLERLVGDDWTMDPEIWSYRIAWHPPQYRKGVLAESWEFPDLATHIVHLRKEVHWSQVATVVAFRANCMIRQQGFSMILAKSRSDFVKCSNHKNEL